MTAPTVREVVTARKQYLLARETYQVTGEGFGAMGGAHARWKSLEHHCAHSTTKPSLHTADFETTVQGIPCGVVVTHWGVDRPAVIRQDPNDSWDAEYESPEWFLVDRRGYTAEWLQIKVTREDRARIDAVILGVSSDV